MDEILRQLVEAWRAVVRHRWIGLAVAGILAVVGAVALSRMPDRFEASSRIFVDTQSVLKPLMSGLAVQPDINEQIALLARTIITRPNIEKLVREADLTIRAKDDKEREALIDGLVKEIKLTGGGRENLYNVSYRDTDKDRALRIVQKLTTMFVESGLGDKKKDTKAAKHFIDDQIKSYERKLAEAEGRLKDFKLRNLNIGTASSRDFFAQMTQINEELQRLRVELSAEERSRDALKRELAGEDPILLAEPTPQTTVAIPELDSRLDQARKQLDELQRRYTDAHPDVVASRRLVAELKEQRDKEVEARRKAMEAASQRSYSSGNNPVFQRIKIALAETESRIASLRGRINANEARLGQLKASAGKVPQIEAELVQMNRDYEILRRQYEQMVMRRESASIAEDVDATTQMADFRVIDPPRVLPRPVFPNRALFAPLVLLGALCAGAFAAFAIAHVFPTIDSSRALREIGQRPVLGSVTMFLDGAAIRKRWISNIAFAGSSVALLMAFGLWFTWIRTLTPT
jgi:polysaccharide chain length determinant protein (PEP-CTERM system associated)